MSPRNFYEFFAGGGMAHAGLGDGWICTFANDFDPSKAATYTDNWGPGSFLPGDVADVSPVDLPGRADLAWASFPCQDLSLAGNRKGLEGGRSGSFWPFWNLMTRLGAEGRGPRAVIFENVHGVLTSANGRDFAALGDALASAGYKFGAVAIDGELFVPQSRPRIFILGINVDIAVPTGLVMDGPSSPWHPSGLVAAVRGLSPSAAASWIWWGMPNPPLRVSILADIVDEDPIGVPWHTEEATKTILSMMSPVNLAKVREAEASGQRKVGAAYRRTRIELGKVKVQRWEVRFDGVAGCLRTPGGGSSRQVIMVTGDGLIRTRLLSPREAARLMGLPDTYKLPARNNDAWHITGDGLVVPAVAHIARYLLEPLLDAADAQGK